MNLEEFEVREHNLNGKKVYYVSDGHNTYVHTNLTVHHSMNFSKGEMHYLKTRREAEKRLKAFKDANAKMEPVVDTIMVPGPENYVERIQKEKHLQLVLENDTIPTVTPLVARLVTDGDMVVLELKTPNCSFYWSVARLEVKNGKVVMYRERDIEDELIKTDSQGRIQN